MPKNNNSIPVNYMADKFGEGIAIGKATIKDLRTFKEAEQSHRDDYHLFFLQEKGTTPFEIDFQRHKIQPSSVMYIHPNQVHRMVAFENVTLSFLAITTENLHPEYVQLLEDIAPARPLFLEEETFSTISEAVSLSIRLSDRRHEKLYYALLKDSCNTIVGLIASQYLELLPSPDKLSRFEIINKAFKALLERNFSTAKKPADYAKRLHITPAYLNECVKYATGHPVSYHIQQRIVLEAKRLLYHSNKSVKEIAAELGFEEYNYFSRLFTKVAGTSALTFRNKNRD